MPPDPSAASQTPGFSLTCPLDPSLRVLGAVMVVLVQPPGGKGPPRFVVSGPAGTPEPMHQLLLGGLDTLYQLSRHEAGKLSGATEEKKILLPGNIPIPPFAPRVVKG